MNDFLEIAKLFGTVVLGFLTADFLTGKMRSRRAPSSKEDYDRDTEAARKKVLSAPKPSPGPDPKEP